MLLPLSGYKVYKEICGAFYNVGTRIGEQYWGIEYAQQSPVYELRKQEFFDRLRCAAEAKREKEQYEYITIAEMIAEVDAKFKHLCIPA